MYDVILNISGGATKISGLFGAAKAILKNTTVDLITGISSGAILAVPLALGLFDEIEELILNVSMEDMFKINPYKEDKISNRAILRVLFGKSSLGTSNVANTLKSLISEERFNTYKTGDYPDVEIGVVDYNTGEMLYYKVKELCYDDYITLTVASTSIPIIYEPVNYKGRVLYDGGVREHIASIYTIENYDPKTCYNVYSRPKDNKVLTGSWKLSNILSVVDRTQQIQFTELEKRSDKYLELLLEKKNINVKSVYLPRIMQSLFDIDKERIKELYLEGYKQGTALFD